MHLVWFDFYTLFEAIKFALEVTDHLSCGQLKTFTTVFPKFFAQVDRRSPTAYVAIAWRTKQKLLAIDVIH